jgi:hypothetical protein
MVLFRGETKCRSLTSEKACQIKQHDNLRSESKCPVEGDLDKCPLRADRGNHAGRPCIIRKLKNDEALSFSSN